ncbi:hypothetical protein V1264_021523 [Littorina saxatilis]
MYSDKTVEEQQNMTMDEWNSSLSHWATGDDGFPELQIPLHHIPSSNVTHPCGKVLTAAATQNGGGCWTEEPETVMTTAEVTILATILVTVFTCSVVANALVCVVFSKRRSSLSLSNCFLANLTLCNVLFTLLVMPFAFVSLVSRTWLFGAVLCQCTGLAINLLVSASIFTLAVISLDRYCAVVTPLHYTMRMTRRRCWAFIGGIWVASAVVSFPPVVGWNGFKFHVNKMICTVDWASPDPVDRYYTLFLVSLSFVLPLVAMLWTYSCIFRAARDNSERTRRSSIVPSAGGGGGGGGGSLCGGGGCGDGDLSQSTPINKRRRSSSVPIIRRLSQTSHRSSSLLQRREEWKTAVTSFLILFSFMLCWLPYFIVICIRSLAPELQLHPVMSTISSVAAMFGCACNPLVYVFRSKATRQDLKVILTRRRTFRNETVHGSAVRRGGSMRSERGEGGGSGGVGGGQGRGGVVEREKGSVFWHEDMFSQFGECHSIQEESSEPAGTDNVSSGTTTHSGSITATPSSLRASPSLQRC